MNLGIATANGSFTSAPGWTGPSQGRIGSYLISSDLGRTWAALLTLDLATSVPKLDDFVFSTIFGYSNFMRYV